jgi:predicted nuclease of predicted toxin-antitoxin system
MGFRDWHVIWLDVGNAGTRAIEELLRRERPRVEQLSASPDVSLLILSIGPSAV